MVDEIDALGSDNTPNEGEPENTPGEAETPDETTQNEAEPALTKEQKSKLDSFDRIYTENKKLKERLKSSYGKTGESEEVDVWVTSNDPLEVVKLGKVLQGYNEEETEFIIRNASKKNIEGIIKAEKDPWVQSAIQSTREKVVKESKIPEPSFPAGGGKEEDIEKIVKEGGVEKDVERKMEELLKKEGRGGGI